MSVAEPQLLTRQQLVPELQRLLAAGASSHDLLVVAAHFRRMELERWLWRQRCWAPTKRRFRLT